MSWQGEISTMVRYLINDVDPDNYKYSDSRVETTVLVASNFVNYDADFLNNYTINVEKCMLSPDPTDDATRDDSFVTLVTLRTACLIVGSEIRTEASNAIAIKDGPSAIDLRGVASTLTTLYKSLTDKYDELLTYYIAGGSVAGQAILGPYSPASDWVSRTRNDYDMRGGYFRY